VKKILLILSGVLLTQSACDLQPRVVSFPDTVGEFISARYPALLADPYASPEIYNSAATDYGVYASPNLYGTESSDDYVMYASVNDYIVPPQSETNVAALYGQEIVAETTSDDYLTVPTYAEQKIYTADENTIVVKSGDTLYALAKEHGLSVSELATLNGLTEPYQLSVGQKLLLKSKTEPVETADVLQVNKPENMVQTTTRVELQEIVVARGDTLYSISRKYSIPVNDLAVMNKLTPPFELSVGQKLRVPNLAEASVVRNATTATGSVVKLETKAVVAEKQTTAKAVVAQPVKKISSDPTKKLPTISARSSSKFAWPVRGKILSAYGAKSNGLFNDGINISATRGTAVKAAENGVVAYAGNEVKGMGNLVIVQHDGGWMTVYAHMDSMNVRRGHKVSVGQKIGTVGETGKVDSPQLHFEIRKGTKAYNPSSYLKK
jgi:murein DD-endopeptidase MepM/ murein hydrolase activator NlpD